MLKMKFNKKGAMFGLDARIALAIFGALSVISGAALYSAIQQAKAVQWQTYFNELAKASEAYYLDTGREIPITSNTSYDNENLLLSINDLVINEDNVAGWQGPYWQDTEHGTATSDYYIKDSMTKTIHANSVIRFSLKQSSTWDNSIDTDPYINELCSINITDCSEYVSIFGGSPAGTGGLLKLFNLLDEKMDGGDGAYAGNVRYSTYAFDWLFVKGRNRIYRGI